MTSKVGGDYGNEARPQSALGLAGLIGSLAVGGFALYALSGPPRLPAQLPSFESVGLVLRGSYLPLEAVSYLFNSAAWLLWFWIVLSLALRVLAVCADELTSGAAWARALRGFSDLTTLPPVRRLVDGVLVAVLVANLLGRGAPAAVAAPLTTAHITSILPADAGKVAMTAAYQTQASEEATYRVQPGDTLWGIAERFYADGNAYPRLVAANAGKRMADGLHFERTGVIQPGWVLTIPGPTAGREPAVAGDYYTVRPGDSLRSIAATLLGDEARWPEVYRLNRGVATTERGQVLSDPDLIWPGLPLRLPGNGIPTSPAQQPPARPQAAPSATATAVATPTPIATATPRPATSAPLSITPMAEPTAAATTVSEAAPVSPSLPIEAAVAGAGLALAAGGAVLIRRRVRRSLDERPQPSEDETNNPVAQGFAEAQLARAFAHRHYTGEREPAENLAQRVRSVLGEAGLANLPLLWLALRRGEAELVFEATAAEGERLAELKPRLEAALGGRVTYEANPDHDTVFRVSGLKTTALAAPTNGRLSPLGLFPLGLTPRRAVMHSHLPSLGSTLLAGSAADDVGVVLTSMLAGLCAHLSPEEISLHLVIDRHALPPQLEGLPHLQSPVAEATDNLAVERTIDLLQGELLRRAGSSVEDTDESRATREPLIVLAVGDLGSLASVAALDSLVTDGPKYGIHVLGFTSQPAALDDATLACFGSRLVLATDSEEQSIRLLGCPDAADLGGGGDLFVRVGQRLPVRARGYRVAEEHLESLVVQMREHYPNHRPANPSAGEMDETPVVRRDSPVPSEEAQGACSPVAAAAEAERSTEPPFSEPTIDPSTADASGAQRVAAQPPAGAEESTAVRQAELGTEGSEGEKAAQLGQPPLIEIRCFGEFRVLSRGKELTKVSASGGQPKAWEMLAFLAVQAETVSSKEKVAEALWPEADPGRSLDRIGVTVSRLRPLLVEQVPDLSPYAIRSERHGGIGLNAEEIDSDVRQFVRLCRQARESAPAEKEILLARACALYKGDVLGSTTYPWLTERADDGLTLQEKYRQEFYSASRELAALYRRQGQPSLAVPIFRAILRYEPILEDVVRDLFRCHFELRDKKALLQEERKLRKALRDVYSEAGDTEVHPDMCEPERETQDLFEQLAAELEAWLTRN